MADLDDLKLQRANLASAIYDAKSDLAFQQKHLDPNDSTSIVEAARNAIAKDQRIIADGNVQFQALTDQINAQTAANANAESTPAATAPTPAPVVPPPVVAQAAPAVTPTSTVATPVGPSVSIAGTSTDTSTVISPSDLKLLPKADQNAYQGLQQSTDPDAVFQQKLFQAQANVKIKIAKAKGITPTKTGTPSSVNRDLIPFMFAQSDAPGIVQNHPNIAAGVQSNIQFRIFIMGVEVSDYISSLEWSTNASSEVVGAMAAVTLSCRRNTFTLTQDNLQPLVAGEVNWVISDDSQYSEEAKRDLYNYKQGLNFFEATTAIPRWNLAPNTCIIHSGDTIRIFSQIPWTKTDAWLPVFNGYVEDVTLTRTLQGIDTISFQCNTLVHKLTFARVFSEFPAAVADVSGPTSHGLSTNEIIGKTNVPLIDANTLIADSFMGLFSSTLLNTTLEGMIRFVFFGDISQINTHEPSNIETVDAANQAVLAQYLALQNQLVSLQYKAQVLNSPNAVQIASVQAQLATLASNPAVLEAKGINPKDKTISQLQTELSNLQTSQSTTQNLINNLNNSITADNAAVAAAPTAYTMSAQDITMAIANEPRTGVKISPTSALAKAQANLAADTDALAKAKTSLADITSQINAKNAAIVQATAAAQLASGKPIQEKDKRGVGFLSMDNFIIQNFPATGSIITTTTTVPTTTSPTSTATTTSYSDGGVTAATTIGVFNAGNDVGVSTPRTPLESLRLRVSSAQVTLNNAQRAYNTTALVRSGVYLQPLEETLKAAKANLATLQQQLDIASSQSNDAGASGVAGVTNPTTVVTKTVDTSTVDWDMEIGYLEDAKKSMLTGFCSGVPDLNVRTDVIDYTEFSVKACRDLASARTTYLNSTEVTIIGKNSGWLGQYSPHGECVSVYMRRPAIGWGHNNGLADEWRVVGPSWQLNDQSKAQMITELLKKLDYYWWVTGNGDIIFEFPLYEFLPHHFGEFVNEYSISGLYSTDTIRENFTDLASTYMFRGSVIGAYENSAGNVGMSYMRSKVFKIPSVMVRKGVEVHQEFWPYITSPVSLEILGSLFIRKHLANCYTYDMGPLPPLLYMTPNTPVYLNDIDAFALADKTSFHYTAKPISFRSNIEFTSIRMKLTDEQYYLKFVLASQIAADQKKLTTGVATPGQTRDSTLINVTASQMASAMAAIKEANYSSSTPLNANARGNTAFVGNLSSSTNMQQLIVTLRSRYGWIIGSDLMINYDQAFAANYLNLKANEVPAAARNDDGGGTNDSYKSGNIFTFSSDPNRLISTPDIPDENGTTAVPAGGISTASAPNPDQKAAIKAAIGQAGNNAGVGQAVATHGNVVSGFQNMWNSFINSAKNTTFGAGFLDIPMKFLADTGKSISSVVAISNQMGFLTNSAYAAAGSISATGNAVSTLISPTSTTPAAISATPATVNVLSGVGPRPSSGPIEGVSLTDPRYNPGVSAVMAMVIIEDMITRLNSVRGLPPKTIQSNDINPDLCAFTLRLGSTDYALHQTMAQMDILNQDSSYGDQIARRLQNNMYNLGGYAQKHLDYIDSYTSVKAQAANTGLHNMQ
jgi:hypothetical protein